MESYQTYLKDCNCTNGGIIIHEGIAVCRWCRTPYGKGSYIYYEPEHFKKEKDIPKDWEILSVCSKDGNCWSCDKKLFDWYLKNSDYNIHQVKRISDGEVFTVGDKCKIFTKGYENVIPFIIDNINVDGNCVFVNKDSGRWNILSMEKFNPEVPLFTTEDGVEKFKGDESWYINETLNIFHCRYITEPSHLSKIKYFHSQDVAKDWLTFNKPIEVSYKEITCNFSKYGTYSYESVCSYLKEFFLTKINP